MQRINSSNSSLPDSVSTEDLIASSVLGVFFMLGVPGNIAVIVYLAGWLKKGSFTPKLMLSLAISDLLTLISLPVWIWTLLHGWGLGLDFCKFLSYVLYLSFYCSILCVVLMSMQRYLQVLHPEKWNKLGRKGKNILLSGMWMLSAVLSCYALVLRKEIQDRGRIQCTTRYENDVKSLATLIWEILLFVVLLFTLIYFYFHLYQGVNRTAFFSSSSLTKLVTRIVVCFFLFWIPLVITNVMIVIALFLGNENLFKSAEAGNQVSGALTFINSCVNPFLYAFSARMMRQQQDGTENT